MKPYFFFLTLIVIIFFSCTEKDDDNMSWFDAVVVGESIDCKNAFLIEFKQSLNGIRSIDNIFVETNLPEKYKVIDKKIRVQIRALKVNDELLLCTTLGPGYNGVFIISALERD